MESIGNIISECEIGKNAAFDSSNSQLNEDLIEVQVSLTDGCGLSQDWLKLKPNYFSNNLNENISEDISVCGESASGGRSSENQECKIDIVPDGEKFYCLQDLFRNDCGDILSLCKNYRDTDQSNTSIEDNTMQLLKKTYAQDVLLSNVQEWLFNITSDKKVNSIELSDLLSGMDNVNTLTADQSSTMQKTSIMQNMLKSESTIKYDNVSNDLEAKSGTDCKLKYYFDPDMERTNTFFNIASLQTLTDAILSENKSPNLLMDLFTYEDHFKNTNQNIYPHCNKTIIKKQENMFNKVKPLKNLASSTKLFKTIKCEIIPTKSRNGNSINYNNADSSMHRNIIVNPIKFPRKKDINISPENKRSPLAMVTFTQDNATEKTKVAIISSNNKQTVFKINTKDVVKAVLSIKESTLSTLGIKSEHMLDIATTASEQLDYQLQLVIERFNKLSDKDVKFPNLSVCHFVKEDLPIVENTVLNNEDDKLKPNNITHNGTTKEKMSCDNKSKQICVDEKIKSKRRINSSSRISSGNNASFSFFSGSSPTMVSRPSVLDSLSVSTESKKDLAGSFSSCNINEKIVSDKLYCKSVAESRVIKFLEELGITLDSLQFYSGPSKVTNWKCPINDCLKFYKKLSKLKVHILSHDGIRPFKCSYDNCDWSFYTNYKLKRHLETHLKRKDFACTEISCNRKFTTIYNLNTHMQLHQKPKLCVCLRANCNAAFQTQKELDKHLYHFHSENDKHPYKCSVDGCTKGFFMSNSLALHSRSHHNDEDLKCNWDGCGKKFDKPCRLKLHMRVHTGLRPHACTFEGCKAAFFSAGKLVRHQRRHTNDRKYSCAICSKAFLRAEHLQGHLLTHSGVRNFHCPIPNCGSKFTAKSSLYVHLKKHKMVNAGGKKSTAADKSSSEDLQNEIQSSSYLGTDCQQMDYITLIGDKDFNHLQNITEKSTGLSTVIPLSFQQESNNRTHSKHLHTGILAPQDALLMQFLDGTSGIALPLESQESTISLSVSDSLFPPTMTMSDDPSHLAVDLGFLDVHQKDSREVTTVKESKKRGCDSSSTRADIINSLIQSKKSKQRNTRCYSRQIEDVPLRTMFSANDVILSDMVNDTPKLHSLQTDSASVFYSDCLSTQDILNYPTQQSTINLRDLE